MGRGAKKVENHCSRLSKWDWLRKITLCEGQATKSIRENEPSLNVPKLCKCLVRCFDALIKSYLPSDVSVFRCKNKDANMGNGLLGVLLVSVLFLATSGYPFHHLTRSRRSRRMPDMQIYKSREMLTRGRRAGVQNRRDISYLSHNPFQPGPAQQAYGFLNPDRTIRTPQSQQMQHVLPPLQPHQPVVQPLLHSVGSHQQGSLPLDGDPGTEQKFQPGLQPNDFPPRHEASNMDVGLSNTGKLLILVDLA